MTKIEDAAWTLIESILNSDDNKVWGFDLVFDPSSENKWKAWLYQKNGDLFFKAEGKNRSQVICKIANDFTNLEETKVEYEKGKIVF